MCDTLSTWPSLTLPSGTHSLPPDFDRKRVAIIEEIEEGTFEGAFLDILCISTKMFVRSSEAVLHIRDRVFERIDPSVVSSKDVSRQRLKRTQPSTLVMFGTLV